MKRNILAVPQSVLENRQLIKTLDSLRYAFHVIFHPFDGFWDLKHEKRGTVGAANIIVFFTLLSRLWMKQFTSFLVADYVWEKVNIYYEIGQVLFPLFIWCLSNWCLTSLFDGKGSMRDIYIMTCFALAPYPLINIPLSFISNILALDELALYHFFSALSIGWFLLLLICGEMMIHDYSLGKALTVTVVTGVGMVIIVVLILMLYSVTSEMIGYFVSLYRELALRVT